MHLYKITLTAKFTKFSIFNNLEMKIQQRQLEAKNINFYKFELVYLKFKISL